MHPVVFAKEAQILHRAALLCQFIWECEREESALMDHCSWKSHIWPRRVEFPRTVTLCDLVTWKNISCWDQNAPYSTDETSNSQNVLPVQVSFSIILTLMSWNWLCWLHCWASRFKATNEKDSRFFLLPFANLAKSRVSVDIIYR